jgi:alpha-beta hydrolase superfamily lysophospholipase
LSGPLHPILEPAGDHAEHAGELDLQGHRGIKDVDDDVDAIIDLLSQGGRRGVVIGLSMGGFFAIRSAQHSTRRDLRALLHSTPAQAPAMPLLLNFPRWPAGAIRSMQRPRTSHHASA